MKGLCFILCAILVLAACSGAADALDIPPPSETVSAFLTYVRDGEYEEARGLTLNDGHFLLDEIEKEYRGIFGTLSYDDVSEEIEDGFAYVTLTISAVDFATVMDRVMSDAFHLVFENITVNDLTDRISDMFMEQMTADYAYTIKQEIVISLEIYDGQWMINMDEALVDAVTGGLLSFAEYAGQW